MTGFKTPAPRRNPPGAGARLGAGAVPRDWLARLENRAHLERLAAELLEKHAGLDVKKEIETLLEGMPESIRQPQSG